MCVRGAQSLSFVTKDTRGFFFPVSDLLQPMTISYCCGASVGFGVDLPLGG